MKTRKELLNEVHSALAKEGSLAQYLSNIYIITDKGRVQLSGEVDREDLKSLIKKIVSSLPKVRMVIDNIRVEPMRSPRVSVDFDWKQGRMVVH